MQLRQVLDHLQLLAVMPQVLRALVEWGQPIRVAALVKARMSMAVIGQAVAQLLKSISFLQLALLMLAQSMYSRAHKEQS